MRVCATRILCRHPLASFSRVPALLLALLTTLALSGCNGFFIDGHTTTALTSTAVSAAYGTSITFTAKVSSTSATGTMVFYDGTTELASETLASGKATYTSTALSTGTHDITAVYSGDSTYEESTSNDLDVVISSSLTSTTTTLASTATAVTYSTSVTLTATVSATLATGTVTFYDGTTELGSATLGTGTATLTTKALAVGTHTLVATYVGDSTYATSSSGTVTITVSAATSS